jgi:hypothetical protein
MTTQPDTPPHTSTPRVRGGGIGCSKAAGYRVQKYGGCAQLPYFMNSLPCLLLHTRARHNNAEPSAMPCLLLLQQHSTIRHSLGITTEPDNSPIPHPPPPPCNPLPPSATAVNRSAQADCCLQYWECLLHVSTFATTRVALPTGVEPG